MHQLPQPIKVMLQNAYLLSVPEIAVGQKPAQPLLHEYQSLGANFSLITLWFSSYFLHLYPL